MLKIQQVTSSEYFARETVTLLRREMSDFIPLDLWPPQILDLNPIDCQTIFRWTYGLCRSQTSTQFTVRDFIPLDLCPPQIPDLNPVHCQI